MINNMLRKTRKNRSADGFTLTELMLAMAFIAFIMLFVVVVLIQSMGIYNKGLALKQINQAGRQIGEDVSRQMRFTNANALKASAVSQGRLCVGAVSYIWNKDDTTVNKLDNGRAPRMIRVLDPSQKYCNQPTLAITFDNTVTELVGSQVVVRDVSVSVGSRTPSLVSINMVLSTGGTGNSVKNFGTATVPDWQCADASGNRAPTNQFCAYGSFSNTVYMRGE